MPTVITEELILANLDTLSHGGKEAIILFMEMCERLYDEGKKGALQDWITIAAPALPEKERNEVLLMLMCSHLYLFYQSQAQFGPEALPPTLH